MWLLVRRKRVQPFDIDSKSLTINSEKLEPAADNVLILDYQQYVSQYLSRYYGLFGASHSESGCMNMSLVAVWSNRSFYMHADHLPFW